MKIFRWLNSILMMAVLVCSNYAYGQEATTTRNVVLVHGAFVDGSGWEAVYNLLTRQGYKVSVTQHTLRSFTDDVAAVNRIIDQQDGPCILVGHSYGGAIVYYGDDGPGKTEHTGPVITGSMGHFPMQC